MVQDMFTSSTKYLKYLIIGCPIDLDLISGTLVNMYAIYVEKRMYFMTVFMKSQEFYSSKIRIGIRN